MNKSINKSSKNAKASGKKNILENFKIFQKHGDMKNMMLKNRKTSSRNIELGQRNKSNDIKRYRSVSKSVDFSIDKKPKVGIGKNIFKSHFRQPDRKYEKRYSLNPDASLKSSVLKTKQIESKPKKSKDNILSIYLNDTKQSKKLVFQSNRHIPNVRKERTRDKQSNKELNKRGSVGKNKWVQQTFQNGLDLKNFRLKNSLKQKSFKHIDNHLTFNNSILNNIKG